MFYLLYCTKFQLFSALHGPAKIWPVLTQQTTTRKIIINELAVRIIQIQLLLQECHLRRPSLPPGELASWRSGYLHQGEEPINFQQMGFN